MTKWQDLPECPACARIVCADCGAQRSSMNRQFPGQHRCSKCGSTNVELIPTRHRQSWRHQEHVELAAKIAENRSKE